MNLEHCDREVAFAFNKLTKQTSSAFEKGSINQNNQSSRVRDALAASLKIP